MSTTEGERFILKINKERWEALVKLRGWKHPITALAIRTGFTKSLCSQVVNGGIAIGHEFMLAVVRVSGADPRDPMEWAGLFEIVRDEAPQSEAYQKDNYAKYTGLKPYTATSDLAPIRRRDKAKSLERLKLPQPIPAIDFYDDAMPKKYQAKFTYKRG